MLHRCHALKFQEEIIGVVNGNKNEKYIYFHTLNLTIKKDDIQLM